MNGPTFCADCDHVDPESRKRHPARWLCLRFPRLEGMGFVMPGVWAEEEPYNLCRNVNKGVCPCFEPARVAPVKEAAA